MWSRPRKNVSGDEIEDDDEDGDEMGNEDEEEQMILGQEAFAT